MAADFQWTKWGFNAQSGWGSCCKKNKVCAYKCYTKGYNFDKNASSGSMDPKAIKDNLKTLKVDKNANVDVLCTDNDSKGHISIQEHNEEHDDDVTRNIDGGHGASKSYKKAMLKEVN